MDINLFRNINNDTDSTTKDETQKISGAEILNVSANEKNITNPAVTLAVRDFDNRWSIPTKETEKYRNQGFAYNNWENLDKHLINSQGALTKIGNSIAQTLVSEIFLGTFKGASDLFDLIGQTIGISDKDYSNPVSATLEKWQEDFRNFAPIHVDPELNMANGGLGDLGWWTSNMPSVASSLTLLIPSSGIVKGLSWLGKAGRAGKLGKAGKYLDVASFTQRTAAGITGATKRLNAAEALLREGASAEKIAEAGKLNRLQRIVTSPITSLTVKNFVENGATAALSRAMENYQEARQTYNDMYVQASDLLKKMSDEEYDNWLIQNQETLNELVSEGVNIDNKDDVAKHIAGKAADRTFKIDWLNVGWDILQMYGLRDAWRGLRSNPNSSAKVRRKNKDSAKYFGKSEEEIKQLKAKRPFKEKATEWISDKAYASRIVVASELSEGAEEALNYIAQQEGMHLGGILLGKNNDFDKGFWHNVTSGFDGRLQQYIDAPALWDSAFWGVMGGVVFQGLGSYFTRLKVKTDTKETEEAKKKRAWLTLSELPQNKAQLTDIEARRERFTAYKTALDQINNDNINPFESTTDNTVTFDNEIDKQAARNRLRKEFIADLTLSAGHAGNLDMLKEFMADENLVKGLVQAGFFNEKNKEKTEEEKLEEAKEFVRESLREINKVQETYDNEIRTISNITGNINTRSNKNRDSYSIIPLEYVQIIADSNVRHIYGLEQAQAELANIDRQISEEETRLKNGNKLDFTNNHEHNIRLGVLTETLKQLRAERRRLTNSDNKSLSNQISIHEIDKRIKSIEDELTDEELIYSTFISLQYEKKDDGSVVLITDQQERARAYSYLDAMITRHPDRTIGDIFKDKYLEALGISDRARTIRDDDTVGAYNVLRQKADDSFKAVKEVSETLNNLYQRKAVVSKQIDFIKANIARTTPEVEYEINKLHNTMNEARIKAIKQSSITIGELYEKYKEPIREYIRSRFIKTDNKNLNDLLKDLSDKEKSLLNDAIDVLDITNPSNQDLVTSLDKMFLIIDAKEATKQIQENNNGVNEESQENTTNQNESTSLENINANNPISAPQSANTSKQGASERQSPETIDPQNIENRNPNHYVKFFNKKGTFVANQPSVKDNGGVAIYDNGDSTYTLDTRKDPTLDNSTQFYSNTNQIDITAPYRVVEYPIAKRNKKGKIEVVSKGRLEKITNNSNGESSTVTNPSTREVVVPSSATTSTEPSVPTQTTNNTQPDISSAVPPVIPAVPVPQPSSSAVAKTQDVEPDQENDADKVTITSIGEFINVVKTERTENSNVTLKEIIAKLEEKEKELSNSFIVSGVKEEIVNIGVEKAKNTVIRKVQQKINGAPNTMKSSVDDVLIIQAQNSTINETPVQIAAVGAYQDAVRLMMEMYAKELQLERINGKLYVNLENLLRYANSITNDSNIAKMIFASLNSFLETEEAKRDYVVMDSEDTMNSNKFLENVSKIEEERIKEKEQNDVKYRVDIDSVFKYGTEKEQLNWFDAFAELNVGDKIKTKILNGKVILLDSKDRQVGSLPIPFVDPLTGGYDVVKDGWRYAMTTSNNGKINSKLKDIFTSWLNPKEDDNEAKTINELIYEAAYTKLTEERKLQIKYIFKNSPTIKNMREQGLISSNATNEELLNHLVKLWRYVNSNTNGVSRIHNMIVLGSLNKWFETQKRSCDIAATLGYSSNGFIVSVDSISEGELIRIVDDGKHNDEEIKEQALPVNKAIAGGVNVNSNKIAICYGVQGVVNISGMPSEHYVGAGIGHTFVTIPNRLGKPSYVRAYPANVVDDFINNDAKEIFDTIQKEISDLTDTYASDNTIENYEKLKNFIKQVFNSNNGNSSLFRNIVVTEKDDYFTVTLKNSNKNFVIYKQSNKIYLNSEEYAHDLENGKISYRKELNIDSKEAKRFIKELLNNANYQISVNYLNSDNVTNTNLNGICTREDGKFVIRIKDKNWTYNSYNEFMLKNNLLKLNTKPDEFGKTNFNHKGVRSQKNNRVFYINVESTRPTSSPVEDSQITTTQQQIPTNIPSGTSVAERVINILNSDSTTKGVDIFKTIIGTDGNDKINSVFSEKNLNALVELDILPKNIIFDPEFNNKEGNENLNAEVNLKTGVVTVGQKWVEMINNPTTRAEAIRKLIHEQLHIKLKNRKGFIHNISDIYNEFKAALENGTLERKDQNVQELRKYLFEDEKRFSISLEEFLVESLTSKELATALNLIETTPVDKKKGIRNLFQKVLDLLSQIFNWGVTKGSLYEKELNTLRETISEVEKQKETTKKTSKKDAAFENTGNLFDENQNPVNTETEETVEEVEEPVIDKKSEEPINTNDSGDISNDLIDMFSSVTETPIEQNYTPEMKSIKEKAIADGTFMKAPNGNPTNLNEIQWLQVRTNAFKNWFGDWINNPSEASKVVDENDEPLVVYHGSPVSDFNIFKKSDVNSGYYFTSDKEYANSYGNTRSFFLNIKNIKDISFTYKKHNKSLWNGKSMEVSEPYYNGRFISPYEEVELELNHKNVDRNFEYYKSKGFDGIKGNDSFNEELNTGSNGIEYVVFSPNQIKSAISNIGEFSTEDDDIRRSSVIEMGSSVSVNSLTEQLPLSNQANFKALVNAGEVMTSCR